MTIIVMTPDLEAPSGGVRTLYRHVDILNALGHEALIWHRSRGFRCSWFDNDTPVVNGGELQLEPGSVVVIPEPMISLFDPAPGIPKVVLAQNQFFLLGRMASSPSIQRSTVGYPPWDCLGIIATSERVEEVVSRIADVPVYRVPLSVDHELFAAGPKERLILYMPRRRRLESNLVHELLLRREWAADWRIEALDGQAEHEVAQKMSSASIFLSFAEREGFGLPGLEALLSGCAVAGFTGGGGDEYFEAPHALAIADGDLVEFVEAVDRLVEAPPSESHMSEVIAALAERYSPAAERRALEAAWSRLLLGVGGHAGSAVHLGDEYDMAANVSARQSENQADAIKELAAAMVDTREEAERRVREADERAKSAHLAHLGRIDELTRLQAVSDATNVRLSALVHSSRQALGEVRGSTEAARGRFFGQVSALSADELTRTVGFVASTGIADIPAPDGLLVGADSVSLTEYCARLGLEATDPHPLISVIHLLLRDDRTPLEMANPLWLYLKYGHSHALSPHPLFDGAWYMTRYHDVRESGANPLLHYLTFGWREGRDPNPLFSTSYYLDRHPDIAASGMCPLVHYAKYGWRELRQVSAGFNPSLYLEANPDLAQFNLDPLAHYLNDGKKEGRQLVPSELVFESDGTWPGEPNRLDEQARFANRVGVISGAAQLHSHLYRVEHLVEMLRYNGFESFWIEDTNLSSVDETRLLFCDVIVVFRTAWTEQLETLINRARQAGVAVIYDIDDYVFDLDVAKEEHVDGIRFLSPADVVLYNDGVTRYRRLMELCDAVTVSTEFLAERVADLGMRVHVVRNGYSWDMDQRSLVARAPKVDHGLVRIGYASGTKTHQRDFGVVVDALVDVALARPEVRILIVGELDLSEFPRLVEVEDRVEIRALVPHTDLPAELARFDINIAPLQVGNPYCEAKSELKWFEAALVGVPTVASPTSVFVGAIDHDRTGLIAGSDDEWQESLLRLVDDAELRARLASAAATKARPRHSMEARAEALLPIIRGEIAQASEHLHSGVSHRVTFLLPGMNKGSGGHGNALALAREFAAAGRAVHCQFAIATDDFPSPTAISSAYGLERMGIAVSIGEFRTRPSDLVVATYWQTVEHAIRAVDEGGGVAVHFVQDYEPWFFAMSIHFLQARDALHRPIRKVAWGHWMAGQLRQVEGLDVDHIDYPLEPTWFHQDAHTQRNDRQVVFFARPDMPRRCFDLVLEAVNILAESDASLDLVLFGTTQPIDDLPANVRNLGVLDLGQLADLYRRSSVGVAFSPTNPSNVPFEMMACGLPVVDIDLPDAASRYGAVSNVVLVRPAGEELATAIVRLVDDPDRRAAVGRAGASFVASFPTRDEVGKQFLRLVDGYLAEGPNVTSGETS